MRLGTVHLGCAIANTVWTGTCLPGWASYRRALSRPDEVQQRLLSGYLGDNVDTEFGRRHGFRRIRSIRDYQSAVPITTYDDYAEAIGKIRAGHNGILTAAPVRRLVPTSGSTGSHKLIPYTDRLVREIHRAIAPWVVDLHLHDPLLMSGAAYWSISPVFDGVVDPGSSVPIGFDEDSAYLGRIGKRLVDATLAVPSSVRFAENFEAFRAATLRYLLRRRDLRLCSVWHPSFLTLLLERLSDEPKKIWPGLRLISCWGEGPAEMYLDTLRRMFPGTTIQPKGLIATEGIVTIPFASSRPLALTSHFFEFLGDDGKAYLPGDLESGAEYSVVLTTGGGFYRYRIGDRVRVTGRHLRTPSLVFLGRESGVSDRFGEKLSEGFVTSVLGDLFDRHELKPDFAMLAPDTDESGWRYTLFLELSRSAPATLADDLDEGLRANPHYRYCVDLGQLAPAAVRRTPPNAFGRFVGELVRRGRRPGEIKPTALDPEPIWAEVFAAPTSGRRELLGPGCSPRPGTRTARPPG